jgi:hypothetical protein
MQLILDVYICCWKVLCIAGTSFEVFGVKIRVLHFRTRKKSLLAKYFANSEILEMKLARGIREVLARGTRYAPQGRPAHH